VLERHKLMLEIFRSARTGEDARARILIVALRMDLRLLRLVNLWL